MTFRGYQRSTIRGRWTYGLAAWMFVAPLLTSLAWSQQSSSVTVVGTDSEGASALPPGQTTVPPPVGPATSWSSRRVEESEAAEGVRLPPQADTLPPLAGTTPPDTPFPSVGLSPQGDLHESKQHFLPIGEPVEKDIVVKDDGGMISLMVRDAPLRQVIALVAETQKLNIVFASPANVPVTASFDRVPWQQAIEALLSISGHTWTMNGKIIFVTSVEAADFVSPQAGGRGVEVFELDFASAVDVDQAIKGLLSQAGNSWILESSTEDNRRTREVVAVVDYPANLARISDYVCQVDQPPRQVLIEAHILQVELNDDCRSGINFATLASFHDNNEIALGFLSSGIANPNASPNDGSSFDAARPNSATFLTVSGPALLGLVEALKSTTDAKTLASPKVLAINGQRSRIQIGDQLGYPVVNTNANLTTQETIQFMDVGVVLEVTPRITRDGRVLIKVAPEVSKGQINPTTQVPSKQTTNVETNILLSDGQGMVIGGLIQEEDSNIQSKIPWFGDLPYVGILFQKRNIIKKRTEIIVTLIPHILPYSAIIDSREQSEFARTQDRLLEGPLHRNPRPYEPRLYDTFTNPRRPIANLVAIHHAHHANVNGTHALPMEVEGMIEFPPVEGNMKFEMLPEIEEEPMIEFPIEQSSYSAPVSTR